MNNHEKHAELMEQQIIEKHQKAGRKALIIYRDKNSIIVKVEPESGEIFEPFLMKLKHVILEKGCGWSLEFEDCEQ